MDNKYKITINACFIGYIVQAIINNFAPLLFLTFKNTYGIELSKITLLVTVNFTVQLAVDFLSIKFIDRLGYKVSIMLAHIFSAIGLISLTVLPELFENAFYGLLISVSIYAVGGGILEVLVSPIVESCPTENKEKAMSLLHSFYCWGHCGVVILSTLFFTAFGIENWKILALIWAVIPIVNTVVFSKAPIAVLVKDGERGLSVRELLSGKIFWVLILMMACAGASEQAVSQWASAFAEQGLGVSKTVGDLAGPLSFAVLMGSSRAFYGKYGDKIPLDKFMSLSCVLCIASYLVIALVPNSVICLVACGVCGLSVGIMWPGSFSTASASIKNGGTAMFAFLALAGDLGCSAGPSVVGAVSSACGDNLRKGILFGTVFPVLLLLGIYLCKKTVKNKGI
ncbi:MAG: MFS transporter [Eubacterium sp.]